MVTEMWSIRKLSRGKSATRGFDVTGASDESEAESMLPVDILPGEPHPLDDTIKIPLQGGIAWDIIVPGKHYRATVSYESTGENEDDEAALAEKWRCRTGWSTESIPMARDANGILIANSAGDVFEHGLTQLERTLEIEIWRWEHGTDIVAKNLAYAEKYNSDSVTLPKIGTLNPGELLLKSISIDEEFLSSTAVVKVKYSFLARGHITLAESSYAEDTIHGFHRRAPSLGLRTWAGFEDMVYIRPIVALKGSDVGQPIREPIRLNMVGQPTNTTAFGIIDSDEDITLHDNPAPFAGPWDKEDGTYYLYFDTTKGSATFSGLEIEANNP